MAWKITEERRRQRNQMEREQMRANLDTYYGKRRGAVSAEPAIRKTASHYVDEYAELKRELTRLQSENAELKKRIVQAIDAVAANKCSSHEDWAQGVNDATDQHADNLRRMFSDIYGSSEQ